MSKKTRKKSPKKSANKTARTAAKTATKTAGKTTAKGTARGMAKKTLKRTATISSGKPTRDQSSTPAKTTAAKTRAAAGLSGKNAKSRQPGASQNVPSEPLKSYRRAETAKPRAQKPAGKEVSGTKASAPGMFKPALAEGTGAPAFRLPRDGGGTISLADFAGKKLVLFFYPRADTPGCTKEAIDFTRLSGAFAESQTAVLGVSADPPKAQEAFRDKHQLAVPLASDEQHAMLEAYGVWGQKSMYGKTFQGILRTTVLIGADGRIARIWRNVKVDGHADDVLAAACAL